MYWRLSKMVQLSLRAILVFVSLISTILQVNCNNDDEKCIPSRQTIERVQACPENQNLWEEQEKKKSCFSIVHNCSRPLVYHCVINPWQNETMEVCAPSTQINPGYCAEYNTRGARIQDFHATNCLSCKTKYWSTEAYKHKECYDAIYKLHKTNNNNKNNNNNMNMTYMTIPDTKRRATTSKPWKKTLKLPVTNCADSPRKHFHFTIVFAIFFVGYNN